MMKYMWKTDYHDCLSQRKIGRFDLICLARKKLVQYVQYVFLIHYSASISNFCYSNCESMKN